MLRGIKSLLALQTLSMCAMAYATDANADWELQQKLDQYVWTKVGNRYQTPGIVAARIDKDGVITTAAAGVRKWDDHTKMTTSDKIHMGSCTKSMTSTMLAQLIQYGWFPNGWNTTILSVFPEYENDIHWGYHQVTLYQLVTMTGGLKKDIHWGQYKDQYDIIWQRRQQMYDNLRHMSGTVGEYKYSNLAYMVAGAMAEKVTGQSWETLMQQNLFGPLGMTSAGFGAPGTPGQVDQPWGHTLNGDTWIPYQHDNPADLGPAGTVHMTIEDWAKYLKLYFKTQTPQILDSWTFDGLTTPNYGNYAQGWQVFQRSWAQGTAIQHSGTNLMWYTVVWLSPATGTAYVACTNSYNRWGGTEQEVDPIIGFLIGMHPVRPWMMDSVDVPEANEQEPQLMDYDEVTETKEKVAFLL